MNELRIRYQFLFATQNIRQQLDTGKDFINWTYKSFPPLEGAETYFWTFVEKDTPRELPDTKSIIVDETKYPTKLNWSSWIFSWFNK